MEYQYLIIAVILFIAEILYFKIADKFNIIDKPNHRSSHTEITLRGGGIIFVVALLVAFIMGYVTWPLMLASVLVAIISFIDDIKELSRLLRISVQLIAGLLVIYDLGLIEYSYWMIPLALYLLIGWINVFNFMDGINGITVLYSLVTLLTFAYLPVHQDNFDLLIIMSLSCVVFGFFNVRKKAKAFSGDVGSITMALFIGYFMIQTFQETENIGYALFLSLYSTDAIITMVMRLYRKEHLSEPHRSHLYQYLANDVKIPHINVSISYALIQLGINVTVITLDNNGELNYYTTAALIVIGTLLYCLVRYFVYTKYVIKNA